MRAVILLGSCYFFSISNALRLNSHGVTNGNIPVENLHSKTSHKAYLDTLEGMLSGHLDLTHIQQTRSKIVNKSDLAVFQVGCGEQYCREMIKSLKSLAVQYTGDKYDVWCVVDEACNKILDQEVPLGAGMTCNPLNIQKLISVGAVPDMFAHCASARLWVPQVLTNYKHLFYMDSDTMILNSIEPALRQLKEQNEVGIFMAEEASCAGCGWYNAEDFEKRHRLYKKTERTKVKFGENGYNSGTIGINVEVWNKQGTVAQIREILQEAKEGKVEIPLPDQDILNLLAKRNILPLQEFPCEFNVRRDSSCRDESGYRMPVILHGNRNIFYNQWNSTYDKLIQQANEMLYEWPNEQRLGTSLLKASRINVSDLYIEPPKQNKTKIPFWGQLLFPN